MTRLVRMLGRCANGKEADSGLLVHVKVDGSYKAVCGKGPGRRSSGWTEQELPLPIWAKMCPKCALKGETQCN